MNGGYWSIRTPRRCPSALLPNLQALTSAGHQFPANLVRRLEAPRSKAPPTGQSSQSRHLQALWGRGRRAEFPNPRLGAGLGEGRVTAPPGRTLGRPVLAALATGGHPGPGPGPDAAGTAREPALRVEVLAVPGGKVPALAWRTGQPDLRPGAAGLPVDAGGACAGRGAAALPKPAPVCSAGVARPPRRSEPLSLGRACLCPCAGMRSLGRNGVPGLFFSTHRLSLPPQSL